MIVIDPCEVGQAMEVVEIASDASMLLVLVFEVVDHFFDDTFVKGIDSTIKWLRLLMGDIGWLGWKTWREALVSESSFVTR